MAKEYLNLRNIRRRYSAMIRQNQILMNQGTSEEFVIEGYCTTKIRNWLCIFFTVITFGAIRLIWHWRNDWKLFAHAQPCSLQQADHVLLKDAHKQIFVAKIQSIQLTRDVCSLTSLNSVAIAKVYHAEIIDKTPEAPLTPTDVDNIDTTHIRYFIHKCEKYIWNNGGFSRLCAEEYDTMQYDKIHETINLRARHKRSLIYGGNSIEVAVTGYLSLLFREILNPFYLFQVFSIFVWAAQEYYAMCGAIALLSILSLSVSLYSTRKQSENISTMSRGSGHVNLLRYNKSEIVDTRDLVPGDIIELPQEGGQMWADCILLTGSCVADESTLTGESIPVFKSSISKTTKEHTNASIKEHVILSGTRIVFGNTSSNGHQVSRPPTARVISTGFLTRRGQLIESIISQRPLDFKLYRDSIRFIQIMAAIGFIGSITVVVLLATQGVSAGSVVLKVLDLITIIVPPGLPAALTVATVTAQHRLKRKGIYCISPPRINVSGKVNLMCFDKTGTITEDWLKLAAVALIKSNTINETTNDVSHIHDAFELYDKSCDTLQSAGDCGRHCIIAMGVCNSLAVINESVVGDPLDVLLYNSVKEMLTQTSKCYIEDVCFHFNASNSSQKVTSLSTLHRFRFSAEHRRMTVVVKNNNTGDVFAYSKGAPQTIRAICSPQSVPSSFDRTLEYHTKHGFRVLALSYRKLNSWNTQQEVEEDMALLGFISLENPLRATSASTMRELHDANIRTVMITGDDLNTGIAVAKKCNMIREDDKVITMTKDSSGCKVDSNDHLVITGEQFSVLRDGATESYMKLLSLGTVYARMKPQQKMNLVEDLQNIGNVVGMCGDGANDCGALKQANVGISLAKIEASIAAPFTSNKPGIQCTLKLLKEGRASITTTVGMFKYLCVYSFVQYMALIFLFSVLSYFNDGQFLLGDIGVTGTVTLFYALAGPSMKLSPHPPMCVLVSKAMLATLFLHIATITAIQGISFYTLTTRTWYTPSDRNISNIETVVKSQESTVMFYISTFQYLVLAVIFYGGLPHRQPIYRNYVYLAAMVVLTSITLLLLFYPVNPLDDCFNIAHIGDIGFKFIVLAYALIHFIMAYVIEKMVSESTCFQRIVDILFKPCMELAKKRQTKSNFLSLQSGRKQSLT